MTGSDFSGRVMVGGKLCSAQIQSENGMHLAWSNPPEKSWQGVGRGPQRFDWQFSLLRAWVEGGEGEHHGIRVIPWPGNNLLLL